MAESNKVFSSVIARSRSKKKIILAILGLLFVVAIAWWQYRLSTASTQVETVPVSRGGIDIFVSAPARIKLPSRADLNFKTAGKIAQINVKKGDKVVAGQVLAELDMTSINPQIGQAEAGLKAAQAGLERLLSGRSKREIAVAEASVQQAATAVENARRNLKTVRKIVAQSKKKAELNIKNAEVGVSTAAEQLNKLKKGPRSEEIRLARLQRDQAYQAYIDAQEAYTKVKELNQEVLDEADQSVYSTQENFDYWDDRYAEVKEAYDTSPTAENKAALDAVKPSYLQAKLAYDGALAARQRVIATNAQSLKTAETQLNAAERAYDAALAQYELQMAGARSEDIAMAQNQLKQAEIALEIAKMGSNDASLDAQIEAAQAQLDSAIQSSKVAVAQLELQKEGPRAADVKQAQAQIEQARSALDAAEAVAEDQVLKAPFSGLVAAVNGKKGEIAGMGSLAAGVGGGSSALITLINYDRIELTADVDETDVSKLRIGQDVHITLDAYEDKVFKGKLMNISLLSSKNATGGTIFEVTVVINPSKEEFREGMTGDVEIVVDSKKNVLTVPFEAVKMDGDQTSVFVVENNIAKSRKIKIGISSDTAYEVKSGLKLGEQVIVGKTDVKDGQRVTIKKDGRIGQ